MQYENALAHDGVKGMHWGQRKANPERDVKRAARAKASAKRGEEALYRSNAFGSPNLAVGMKATSLLMTGASAGLAVRTLVKTKDGPFKSLKQGIAITGLVLTAVGAASTIRDIHDIHSYNKTQQNQGVNNGR